MSENLLDSMMEPCVMMDKTSVSDGMGGFTYQWREGAAFDATIIKMGGSQVIVAEQQGVSELYTIVVHTGIQLDFHDVVKRLSDGATFRVTDYAKDNKAPAASTVQITKTTAERWVIPT